MFWISQFAWRRTIGFSLCSSSLEKFVPSGRFLFRELIRHISLTWFLYTTLLPSIKSKVRLWSFLSNGSITTHRVKMIASTTTGVDIRAIKWVSFKNLVLTKLVLQLLNSLCTLYVFAKIDPKTRENPADKRKARAWKKYIKFCQKELVTYW